MCHTQNRAQGHCRSGSRAASAAHTGGGRRLRPQRAAALCRPRLAGSAGPGRPVQTGPGERPQVAARASPPLCPTGTLRGRGGRAEEGTKRQVGSDHGACCRGDALRTSGPTSSRPPPSPSYSSFLQHQGLWDCWLPELHSWSCACGRCFLAYRMMALINALYLSRQSPVIWYLLSLSGSLSFSPLS